MNKQHYIANLKANIKIENDIINGKIMIKLLKLLYRIKIINSQ